MEPVSSISSPWLASSLLVAQRPSFPLQQQDSVPPLLPRQPGRSRQEDRRSLFLLDLPEVHRSRNHCRWEDRVWKSLQGRYLASHAQPSSFIFLLFSSRCQQPDKLTFDQSLSLSIDRQPSKSSPSSTKLKLSSRLLTQEITSSFDSRESRTTRFLSDSFFAALLDL